VVQVPDCGSGNTGSSPVIRLFISVREVASVVPLWPCSSLEHLYNGVLFALSTVPKTPIKHTCKPSP
jgi:hypothetical protein